MDTYGNLVIGETYSFYGVYDQYFKLGDTVFEAIEDPDDGYRSYLQSVELVDKKIKDKLVFSNKPFANVTLLMSEKVDGIDFLDDSCHCWLSIGTDRSCDYYPCFVFSYDPNKNIKNFAEPLEILDPIKIHPETYL